MKLIKFSIIAVMLLSGMTSIAQQLPQFTQYMYNTISINPAYAGSRETLSVVGLHRSQWVGLDGGPTTQTLSVHAPLRNEKVGLGVSFINDELGYQNFQYLYADFSYTLNLGEEVKLAFGLKAGFTGYSLDGDFQSSEGQVDQVIFGFEDRWKPNIGTGLYLHTNKWYLGLSAPRILNTDYTGNDDFQSLERISYYATAGYVFDIGNDVKFKPATLLKLTNGAPLSWDVTANFLFFEKLWIGPAYRMNENAGAFGGIIDFQISKQLRVGYAYENPTSDLRPYTTGTHEILLMFELFKSKRIKSPRYF
ncbi:type IX secretion system membrane protein PorP/SprF [Sediminibacter sp. Hel_I_10]|uniref:PorP/SprF family type IX secretion system membrane protein n=1 Tax=Sediminibacter sp. Hel_I_10 TaxID=1392490 RepID=UPI00047D98F3|nr:type IX secretion system membrane protein PorP/SprF [Sediminibacter sp. Hel_I_10]